MQYTTMRWNNFWVVPSINCATNYTIAPTTKCLTAYNDQVGTSRYGEIFYTIQGLPTDLFLYDLAIPHVQNGGYYYEPFIVGSDGSLTAQRGQINADGGYCWNPRPLRFQLYPNNTAGFAREGNYNGYAPYLRADPNMLPGCVEVFLSYAGRPAL